MATSLHGEIPTRNPSCSNETGKEESVVSSSNVSAVQNRPKTLVHDAARRSKSNHGLALPA